MKWNGHHFCMLRYFLPLTVLTVLAIAADPCTQKLDRGKDCNKNSTIKYYFDKEDVACYPFKFNGCAGNLNNFKSHDECFGRCHPDGQKADVQHCPGGEPTGVCKDEIILIRAPPGDTTPKPEPPCPKGSYCQSGHPVGLCCSEKLRDKAEKETAANKAECPKGQKVVQQKVEGFNDLKEDVRGKKCEHDFCPKGSKCVQKKTAFCCQ